MSRFAILFVLASCAVAAPVLHASSLEPPYELVMNEAVDSALDDLLVQMGRLPAFAPAPKSGAQAVIGAEKQDAGPGRAVIAIDHSVGRTGERTIASEVLDSLLREIAKQKLNRFEVVEVSPAVSSRVQYVLAAKLTPLGTANTSRGTFRIELVLTELKSSHIIAQCSVRFTAEGVDLTPVSTGRTH